MPEPTRIGTREQILATAQELFTTQGYDATSLRQIAERLHLTKAALYYHFPAKELLLLELTRPLLDGMSRLVTELRNAERTDPRSVLAAYLDLFLNHAVVLGLMAREPATQNHPDIGQRVRMLVSAIQQQLAGADPSPEQAVRSACAMGVVHAVPLFPAESLGEQRETILAAAMAALGAAPSSTSALGR